MSDPATSLSPGQIQFFDAWEPALKDGAFRIEVSQAVSISDASPYRATQPLRVEGPRFVLNPGDIHTTFPPRGSTGQFSNILPHVVFNKRLLPWERDVPGLATTVPWLALFVFDEGELVDAPAAGQGSRTCSVQDLLAPDRGGRVRKPVLDPNTVSEDDRQLSCQTITLSAALFAELAPTARELPFLAHARTVDTRESAFFGLKDEGSFTVVVANRFPRPGTESAPAQTVVHLVSLEGFGDLLTGDAPAVPAEEQVQMVSLASWTFSCFADPGHTFAGLARALAFAEAGQTRPADSLLLRLPVSAADDTDSTRLLVRDRLAAGYVALGYHAPTGEDGFAWYRGPFTPVVPTAAPARDRFASSDSAIIYDPTTGVFDLSLATAWQVGRALALASQSFALTLTRLRRQADAALERAATPGSGSAHVRFGALVAAGAMATIRHASVTGRVRAPVRRAAPVVHPAPIADLQAALARPQVRATLAAELDDSADTAIATAWLGQLLLLRNVPFVHLVPDARMLPTDSIRFFYVDPSWQDALLDGALSVGLATSRAAAVQAAISQGLKQGAWGAALGWRAAQLGQPPPQPAPRPRAGFLLRSLLVSGWPGLAVAATRRAIPVPLLRLEHLGTGVLLCLFDGVPDTVTLTEPQEGLEFGVDDDGRIDIRALDPPRSDPGAASSGSSTPPPTLTVYNPEQPDQASVALRPGGQRVLNVRSGPAATGRPAADRDLLELLAQAMGKDPAAIGSAAFAVQMVKGPYQLTFSLDPLAPADPQP
jgi:hypothetical protein